MIIREEDIRTAAVIGGGACDKLKNAKVAVLASAALGEMPLRRWLAPASVE